ncbi:hypothetical protein MTO96_050302, partial [Rhipicephalus appendiculatus]
LSVLLYPSIVHERRLTPGKSMSRRTMPTKIQVTLPDPSSAGGDCGEGEPQPSQPELRRSTRQRRPPGRY